MNSSSVEAFKSFPYNPRNLTTLRKKPFENIVGKGEDAGKQHFLLFPKCFQPYKRKKFQLGTEPATSRPCV